MMLRKTWKRAGLALLCLALSFSGSATASMALVPTAGAASASPQGEPRVTAQLTTGVVKLGATVNCVVQVEGARQASLDDVPSIDSIRMERKSGPSVNQSMSFVNGRQSYSRTITYAVTFRPLEVGDFVIPPMRLTVDGKQVFTRELTLSVVQDLDGQELGRLEFLGVPEVVYEGQPFTIRMNLGWDKQLDGMVNTANLILPWWNELPGTLEVDQGARSLGSRYVEINVNSRARVRAVEMGEVEVDGKPFRMLSLSRTYVATRSGRLDVSQSWLEFGRVTRRAFSEARETYHTGAPAFSIRVEPLPEEGRPFDFSGGVGRFEVSAGVSRRDVDVGESIKLTVDWTGEANLEFFELPDPSRLESFEGFRVYGKSNEHFYGDRRRVVYDLAPLSAEVYEIPALPLSVFDPESGEYSTVSTAAIPLRVHALEGAAGLEDLEGGGNALLFSHDIQVTPESNDEGGGVGGALILGSWLGLPALWLVARSAVRRHGAPDAPAARRRRAARRRLSRSLARARAASAQALALHEFLGARSGEEPEAWEGRDVSAWFIEHEVSCADDLPGALDALERDLDRSRWAGDDLALEASRISALADRWLKEGL